MQVITWEKTISVRKRLSREMRNYIFTMDNYTLPWYSCIGFIVGKKYSAVIFTHSVLEIKIGFDVILHSNKNTWRFTGIGKSDAFSSNVVEAALGIGKVILE